MTSPLDDAINSSAPLFAPPALEVSWEELPDTENQGVENLADLGDMMTGKWTVEQSLDDGLPDPVTMTGSNDASGKLTTELVGREGLVFSDWDQVPSVSEQANFSTNVIETTIPAGNWGQYMLMALVVKSTTVSVDQGPNEDTYKAWDLVTTQQASTVTLYIWSKRFHPGMEAPTFYTSAPVTGTVWAVSAVGAYDPGGRELQWRPAITRQSNSVGAPSVNHIQQPMGVLPLNSVVFGVWAFTGGTDTWSITSVGDVEVSARWNTTAGVIMSRAGIYRTSTTRNFIQATKTGAAIADVAMFSVALEPYLRPRMSPTQFWSPFNKQSPVYGFDRDTALVRLGQNTVTSTGIVDTSVFYGVMEDIGISPGQTVNLNAASRLRIDANRAISLPRVFGRREGCTVDTLTTYLLARVNKFYGPSPSYMCKLWVPFYGSTHRAFGGPNTYSRSAYATPANPGSLYGVWYPQTRTQGPFHSAMFGAHTSTYVEEILVNAIDLYQNEEVLSPWVSESYPPDQYNQDQFSLRNATGRVSFWIRGDATSSASAFIPAGNDYLAYYNLNVQDGSGNTLGRVWVTISPDRQLRVNMGNYQAGYSTLLWNSSFTLPTDGQWHFYSVSWNWGDGEVNAMRDGVTSKSSYWGTNGLNTTPGWYATDADVYVSGGRFGSVPGKINNLALFHLPVSDFSVDAGYEAHALNFADQWPSNVWPSFTATTRPTYEDIEVSQDESPVNIWEALGELARNTMSMYRATEWDGYEFLPPRYFGEAVQLTPDVVVDTEVNAGDLAVTHDPSKSRNVVTVDFVDTSVDLAIDWALALKTATAIPRGVSQITFPLDYPIAELHQDGDPHGPGWNITALTTTEISAGHPAVWGKHWMTINTQSDGNGVDPQASAAIYQPFTARIISYTSTTVTVEFNNKRSTVMYLANNFQGEGGLGSLGIYGYIIRTADGYVTERDAGSIGTRRERALEVEMKWVQNRAKAQQLASHLVTALARPRAEVVVVTQGDPRRLPGDLVTLQDSQSTQAEGNWRVLKVQHDAEDAKYVQQLQLAYVPPVALWDSGLWDESIWSE